MSFEALAAQFGYAALFLGALLEGETVVLLAGIAAQHGYLALPGVIGAAAVGGFASDQTLFFLGRRYGNRLLARFPSAAARAPRVYELVKRWDVLAVILVRFLYGMRIVGPIVIGSSGIAPWRLVVFNLIGALLWAGLIATLGYFAGQALQQWFGRLEHWHIVVLMVIVIALIVGALFWRRR